MMLLPLLDVAFIGLVGSDPGHVANQILAAEPRLVVKKVATPQLATIARRDDGAAEAVAALGVDGVVTGELVGDARHRALRLVIYRASGAMASLSEIVLVNKKLGKDDVEVLQSNLGDEVAELVAHGSGKTAAKPRQDAKQAAPAQMADVDPFADAFSDAKPAKAKAKARTPMAAPVVTPASLVTTAPAAPAPTAKPVAVASETDSDTVSADEIAALTGPANPDTADLGASASASPAGPELHLAAAAGFGVTGRAFAPGPSTLIGYSASGVGAVHLDGAVEPLPHARVAVALDRTLGMETTLGSTSMATTISRWEVAVSYGISLGSLELAPEVGLGTRSFSMDATAADRTPDNDYTYAIAGVGGTLPITNRITARALVAFEPVVGGTDPLAMQLGSATRWAFDVGGSVDVRATDHIYVRVMADYQDFMWSWSMAGSRGAGGASDSYPTGAIALATRY